MQKTLFPLLLLATATALVTHSCSPSEKEEPFEQPRKIQITDYRSLANIHILIAKEREFFKRQGLDVNVSYVSDSKKAMDALVSGNCDYSGVTKLNLIQHSFKADDIILLTQMGVGKSGAIQTLGRLDKGVSSVADLKGRKVAVFIGGNTHRFATFLLKSHGVALKEVSLVNMNSLNAANAFIAGEVDAVVTTQLFISKIKQTLKDKVTSLPTNSKNASFEMLVASGYHTLLASRKEYLKVNQVEAKKILLALHDAQEFIRNKPKETADIVAKHLNLPSEKIDVHLEIFTHSLQSRTIWVDAETSEVVWLQSHDPQLQGKKSKIEKELPVSPLFNDNFGPPKHPVSENSAPKGILIRD